MKVSISNAIKFNLIISITLIVLFLTCESSNEEKASYYWRKGYEYFSKGNIDSACYWYKKSIEYDSTNASVYQHYAAALRKKGSLDEALKSINKAIQLSPGHHMSYRLDRARIYFGLSNIEKAIKECTEVIEFNLTTPENRNRHNEFDAYMLRALYFEEQGNFNAAILDYTKALNLDSTSTIAYYNRGFQYDRIGNQETALLDYKNAIKYDSSYSKAYNNIGYILLNRRDRDGAIEQFTKAIEFDSLTPLYYTNRGLALLKKRNSKDAKMDFQKAISIDSKYARAYHLYAQAFIHEKNWKEALINFSKAIENDSLYAEAYYSRGNLYQALGDYKSSINDLEMYIRLRPNSPKNQQIKALLTALKSNLSKK